MKKKLRITSNFQKNITISQKELKHIKGGTDSSNVCCKNSTNFYTYGDTSYVDPACQNDPDPIG